VVLGLGVAGLAVGTYVHNRVWQDDLTLWTATVAAQPNSILARTNLGFYLLEQGETDEAIEQFEIALATEKRPYMYLVADNLAGAYLSKGKHADAVRAAKLGLEFAPNMYYTRFVMARVYDEVGQPEEAAKWYREALSGEASREQVKHAAYAGLAMLWCKSGHGARDAQEALEYASKAYGFYPDVETGLPLVEVLRLSGRRDQAIPLAQSLLKQQPVGSKAYAALEEELRLMGAASKR
jgi:tetratricopeptide (TPR) repeat protein